MKQRYEHQIKMCETYKEEQIITEEQRQGWELVGVRGLSTFSGSFTHLFFKRPVESDADKEMVATTKARDCGWRLTVIHSPGTYWTVNVRFNDENIGNLNFTTQERYNAFILQMNRLHATVEEF